MHKEHAAIAPQIVEEASEWFIAMREPSVSASDRESFAEWLRASPVHAGAYVEIVKLWSDSSRLSRDFEAYTTSDLPENVIPLRQGAGLDSDARVKHEHGASPASARSRHFALAAGFAFACLIGAGFWWNLGSRPTYTTGIGEQRAITLEDGSVVHLNSRSKLRVHLSSNRRDIDLMEGQALFQVAHDRQRPFLVSAGAAAILAVGTEFDVNRRQSGTVVTVVEGRVEIDSLQLSSFGRLLSDFTGSVPGFPDQSPGLAAGSAPSIGQPSTKPAPLVLSAGEQAAVVTGGSVSLRPKASVAVATGWLRQEFIFQGEPLRDVIEEFNRFSKTHIVLTDPSLGDLRINAVFHTTNPASLLRFVNRFDGIAVDESGDEIRIYRKP